MKFTTDEEVRAYCTSQGLHSRSSKEDIRRVFPNRQALEEERLAMGFVLTMVDGMPGFVLTKNRKTK